MSIAENGYRRGEETAIGDLLGTLPSMPVEQLDMIERMDTAAEQLAYAAMVERIMADRPECGSRAAGERVRDRVRMVLQRFSRKAPVSLPVSSIRWRNLLCLVNRVCANEWDWDARSGPIIGSSNIVLETVFERGKPRDVLAELQAWGFIIPYQQTGNGKRFYAKGNDRLASRGAGYSLAPLVLLVDYLEQVETEEEALEEENVTIPRAIRDELGQVYAIARELGDHDWASSAYEEAKTISAERKKVLDRARSAGKLQELRQLLSQAQDLLINLRSHIAQLPEFDELREKIGTRTTLNRHHHKNNHPNSLSVSGLAKKRSGDRSANTSEAPASGEVGNLKERPSDRDDPFGIERVGFKWREVPSLFPHISGLVDFSSEVDSRTLQQICRASAISDATCGRAYEQLGLKGAIISALITGQHAADGAILKSADVYLRGMMKRGRQGDLNLGNSIFGRRETHKETKTQTNH